MAKRFIDSDIWEDPWFHELKPLTKLFWIYVFSKCDIIGLWEYSPKIAEFHTGNKYNWEDIASSLSEKILVTDKYWIIKNFIRQQYPKINDRPDAPLHRAVLNEIEKKRLNFDLNSLLIDYTYTMDSLQVIVKEKEKVKEEVKDKEKEQTIESWKSSFEHYKKQEMQAYTTLCNDQQWVSERQRYHPKLDILLSLEKAHVDFWSKEAGWKHKKKSKSNDINWVTTYQNALTLKSNQVWVAENKFNKTYSPDNFGKNRPSNEYDITDN